MAAFLLAHGARPDQANRYGATPLRAAVTVGSLPLTEALLKAGAAPDAVRRESGDTPLMLAARAGHAPIVRALLARGAQVDRAEPLRKQTALMWAAAEGHADVVRLLLEGGASTKARSKTGISPFSFAIRSGSVDTARAFLDAGVDVNEAAADGTRPLVLAILNAHFELAAMLLERGADAKVEDPHGQPLLVLTFMRRAENRALSTVLPRQLPQTGVDAFALAKLLVARGADVNARYRNPGPPRHVALGMYRIPFAGATPFYVASIVADVPFMRFLVSLGADPKTATDAGITPLLAASGIGYWQGETPGGNEDAFEAVKLAFELGNDPTAVVPPTGKMDPTWLGANAMHGAANRGSSAMVRWLAEKGVPLDVKSVKGLSPYHIAAGLDNGQFQAWPETATVILDVAKGRGVAIDTREPALNRGGR
jgi:ankyrin repeat protein